MESTAQPGTHKEQQGEATRHGSRKIFGKGMAHLPGQPTLTRRPLTGEPFGLTEHIVALETRRATPEEGRIGHE